MSVRAFPARSSTSSRNSIAPSMSWSAATPIRPMSARSTDGWSPRRQIRHARHRDRPQARSRRRATSSAPGPTTPSSAPRRYARDPEQTALLEAYDRVAAPIANASGGLDHGNAVARAQQRRRERARRYHRRRPARRDQRRGKRRRGDRLHQSGRHPHRHRAEGGRRGDLCRRVRQPAVPQSAGDADADRQADQGHARTAMARSETAADPAGLEGFCLCMGRLQSRTASASSPSGCR